MCWLIDFDGYSSKNAPPIKVTMNSMSVLQNHFPERLGCAVCYHAPWLFSATFRVRRQQFTNVYIQWLSCFAACLAEHLYQRTAHT